MVFLVFGKLLRKSVLGRLSEANAYRLLRLVTVCVWIVGLAGIAAWVWERSPAPQTEAETPGIKTEGAQSPVVEGTEGDVNITIEGQTPGPDAAPASGAGPETDPSAIETHGPQSPVVEGTGGDVQIDIGGKTEGDPQ